MHRFQTDSFPLDNDRQSLVNNANFNYTNNSTINLSELTFSSASTSLTSDKTNPSLDHMQSNITTIMDQKQPNLSCSYEQQTKLPTSSKRQRNMKSLALSSSLREPLKKTRTVKRKKITKPSATCTSSSSLSTSPQQKNSKKGRRRSGNSVLRCEICNECYSRKDNLRVHQRVHSGVKPFECSYCGIRFRWMGAWRSHESLHTRGNLRSPSSSSSLTTSDNVDDDVNTRTNKNKTDNTTSDAKSSIMSITNENSHHTTNNSDKKDNQHVNDRVNPCQDDKLQIEGNFQPVKEELRFSNCSNPQINASLNCQNELLPASTETLYNNNQQPQIHGQSQFQFQIQPQVSPQFQTPNANNEFDLIKNNLNLVQVVTDEDITNDFFSFNNSHEKVWPQILDCDLNNPYDTNIF